MADDLGYGDVPWNNPYLVEKMPNLHKFRSDGMVVGKDFYEKIFQPPGNHLHTNRCKFF